jgi:hypothetical protein
MGVLLKIVIICIVVYYSVKFVAGFVLPIYLAAKKLQMQKQQANQKNSQSKRASDTNSTHITYKGGDYIEYEEIENR